MLEVRSYRPADLGGVETVLLAAFGSPVASADVIRFASEPHHIIVAVDGRAVIGLVASTRYGSASYVGPMAVHPERQNQGIGRAILLQLIARLERQGVSSMALEASDAGMRLYKTFGFTKIDMTQMFERSPKPESEAVACIVTRPSAHSTREVETALSVALRFDAVAYDYDRGTIFRHIVAMEREPRIVLSDAGYAFARTTVLGPWVAMGPDDAAALLEQALAERPSIERVFVPERNVHAARLLSEAGFEERSTSTYMTRGAQRVKRECVYGLISPALG